MWGRCERGVKEIEAVQIDRHQLELMHAKNCVGSYKAGGWFILFNFERRFSTAAVVSIVGKVVAGL